MEYSYMDSYTRLVSKDEYLSPIYLNNFRIINYINKKDYKVIFT